MVHIVVVQAVQVVQAAGCTRVVGRTVLEPVAVRIELERAVARIVPGQVVADQIVAWVAWAAGVEIVSVDQ